ncbi:Protein-L-isoaspartate O-methyltransferase [hydrothermal vent metagenome]|uniref:Protein-L-isoaspartate O-methyltransferase n=1 Tax=hydrothermal vent metagenome TaxID=652676 RepID=A0A3B1AAQ6_9ZZZZ
MSLNFEQARFNMIEQQIRPAEVLDYRVLDTIAATPREDFVPEDYRELAFSDINVPISDCEIMMKPIMEARLLQALDVQSSDKILEIGTGSGYFSALLATLGQSIDSIDIDPALQRQAQARLTAQGISNVSLIEGDAAQGWDDGGSYDIIAITGSLPILPESLKQKLTVTGRLIAIIGTAPAMEATLITRIADDQWSTDILFETELPALKNAEQPQGFVF